ncbi:MAG: RHS repeat-associated core domain-containing protein [Candidatus Omnitrophica bacterium]|nr:RHS repeat-associated core domain-containing protein [Candidatus Omnitrophota bacterium]
MKSRYTHGAGIDEPLLMERDVNSNGQFSIDERFSYHADGLGSIVDLTNNVGVVTQSYVYDSFGNILRREGNLTNPYTYTGRELDTESGLYYYRARYMDPTTGRFLQEDPLGYEGGLNLYSYVNGNPINYIDPSGLLTVYIWNYRGKNEGWGHASMKLENNRYISWWPGPQRSKLIFPMIYSAPAIEDQSFDDDVSLEEQMPDMKIEIQGLDEQKIEAWWDNFSTKNRWRTLRQNCSTTVAEGLKAGGGGRYSSWGKAHNIIWTPNDVKRFAETIRDNIRKRGR